MAGSINDVSQSTKIVKHTDGEYYYDLGADGIKDGEDLQVSQDVKDILNLLSAKGMDITGQTLNDIMKSIDQMSDGLKSAEGGDEELTKLSTLLEKIKSVEGEINSLKTAGKTDEAKLMTEVLKKMKAEASQLLDQAAQKGAGNDGASTKSQFDALKSKMKTMELKTGAETDKKGATVKMTTGGAAGGAGQKGAQGGKAANAPAGASWSYGGGAGGKAGFGGFNMDAYLNSTYMDQATMDGWDAIGKNQMNQKKMMMLFMYLAKMAMSGDLSAMYRFMQFITWMISKDKASQNVMMASKLIQYENASREALQELLDTPPPDSNNQSESYEFTKIMERTRAQQSSMATSQKLISQMMEEMAQVVEALTGVTKSILDANGAVGKLLNRF